MFHVGQRVICVDARPFPGYDDCEVRTGSIYTVRWIGLCSHPQYLNLPSLRVEEVYRGGDTLPEWHDMPFAAFRFRPVIERKTDISVFTAMLAPTSNRDLVKAKG